MPAEPGSSLRLSRQRPSKDRPMQPPPFVAANLDAIQSRANRAGSDARAAARSLAEVQANPAFFVRQGFSLTDKDRKIAATEASLAQARADGARFRELHRL